MWWKIIGPVVALSVAFGAGWTVANWRASGKIEKATATATAATLEAATSNAERDVCLTDIAAVKADLLTKADEAAEAQRLYDEATSRPPERVTVYRDRWREVPAVITSEDCAEGLGQLFTFIGSLPVRGVIHETPN